MELKQIPPGDYVCDIKSVKIMSRAGKPVKMATFLKVRGTKKLLVVVQKL